MACSNCGVTSSLSTKKSRNHKAEDMTSFLEPLVFDNTVTVLQGLEDLFDLSIDFNKTLMDFKGTMPQLCEFCAYLLAQAHHAKTIFLKRSKEDSYVVRLMTPEDTNQPRRRKERNVQGEMIQMVVKGEPEETQDFVSDVEDFNETFSPSSLEIQMQEVEDEAINVSSLSKQHEAVFLLDPESNPRKTVSPPNTSKKSQKHSSSSSPYRHPRSSGYGMEDKGSGHEIKNDKQLGESSDTSDEEAELPPLPPGSTLAKGSGSQDQNIQQTEAEASTSTLEENSGEGKRRAFSFQMKLQLLKQAKQTSIRAVSKKYKISRGSIQSWIQKEDQLRSHTELLGSSIKRLPGAGRKLTTLSRKRKSRKRCPFN